MSEELRRGIPQGRIIGYEPPDSQKEEQKDEIFEAYLRKIGQLKEGEHLEKVDYEALSKRLTMLQKNK